MWGKWMKYPTEWINQRETQRQSNPRVKPCFLILPSLAFAIEIRKQEVERVNGWRGKNSAFPQGSCLPQSAEKVTSGPAFPYQKKMQPNKQKENSIGQVLYPSDPLVCVCREISVAWSNNPVLTQKTSVNIRTIVANYWIEIQKKCLINF